MLGLVRRKKTLSTLSVFVERDNNRSLGVVTAIHKPMPNFPTDRRT